MISAKDEFFLEREHIKEIANLIRKSDLTSEEIEALNIEKLSENEFDLLKRELKDSELKEREAIRRGRLLKLVPYCHYNNAVNQAVNDPTA